MASVDFSIDCGQNWRRTQLGKEEGKYGLRPWQAALALSTPAGYSLLIRRTNTNGVPQPDTPNWNPAGFMRNVVESIDIMRLKGVSTMFRQLLLAIVLLGVAPIP